MKENKNNFTLDNFEEFAKFVVSSLNSIVSRFESIEGTFDKHTEDQQRFEKNIDKNISNLNKKLQNQDLTISNMYWDIQNIKLYLNMPSDISDVDPYGNSPSDNNGK